MEEGTCLSDLDCKNCALLSSSQWDYRTGHRRGVHVSQESMKKLMGFFYSGHLEFESINQFRLSAWRAEETRLSRQGRSERRHRLLAIVATRPTAQRRSPNVIAPHFRDKRSQIDSKRVTGCAQREIEAISSGLVVEWTDPYFVCLCPALMFHVKSHLPPHAGLTSKVQRGRRTALLRRFQ